jgi:hypothetical protein
MQLTVDNILDQTVLLDQSEEITLRDYLTKLFLAMWTDPESFEGKYGISGTDDWLYLDIFEPLEELVEESGIEDMGLEELEDLVNEAIKKHLFKK